MSTQLYKDEKKIRLVAAQVVLLTAISLFTHSLFPLFLLAADFALRAFSEQRSPLAAIAGAISELLKWKPKLIFAAPKKFAAAIGFIFSLSILILAFLQQWTAAYIVGGVLIFFAALEAVLNICVGCYVYNYTVAPFINRQAKASKD